MADNPAPNGGAQAQSPETMPSLNALAQYAKDFSFENPNAPRSLSPQQGQGPTINIQVNVNAKQLAETDFEVDLKLEGDGKVGTEVLFAFDLTYSGVFRARNIPAEHLHRVIMIECPRLLFPFARQMVADAVRNGGFPPLYIDPIDFLALYNQKAAEQQGQVPGQPSPAGGNPVA
ncbi:MAG TPA: protein-export chaperone SecB [Beijerinckiaceae bacterium]|jgi:preprotein translocase subunit SecB